MSSAQKINNTVHQHEYPSRYLDPNSPLSRFYSDAPYLPRCSSNKTATLIRPKQYAINYPYIQCNQKDMTHWIVFDIDSHSNLWIWKDEGLPPPNMIVRNKESGRGHLYYAIEPVCRSKKARQHPIDYMKAIDKAYRIRLNADFDYSGPIAKTPGHPQWQTTEIHNTVYELGYLADFVDLEQKPRYSKTAANDYSYSRTMTLFHDVRFTGYKTVAQFKQHSNYPQFENSIRSLLDSKNHFSRSGYSHNLQSNEIKSIAKSIAQFCWFKYDENYRKPKQGPMGLSPSLSLQERQQRSAARTHQIRRDSTLQRINEAFIQLQQLGQKITNTALAKLTGFTRQTIAKYKTALENEQTTPEKQNETINRNVKYGVAHKVAAPQGPLKENHSGCDPQITRAITPVPSTEASAAVLPFPYSNDGLSSDIRQTNSKCQYCNVLDDGSKWPVVAQAKDNMHDTITDTLDSKPSVSSSNESNE